MKQKAQDRVLLTHKMDNLIRVLKDTAQTHESHRISSQEDQVDVNCQWQEWRWQSHYVPLHMLSDWFHPTQSRARPQVLVTLSVIASYTATSVSQEGPDDTSTSHAGEVRGNRLEENEVHLHEGYGQDLMDPPIGRCGDGHWAPP